MEFIERLCNGKMSKLERKTQYLSRDALLTQLHMTRGAHEENIIGYDVGRHLDLNFDQMHKTQQNK